MASTLFTKTCKAALVLILNSIQKGYVYLVSHKSSFNFSGGTTYKYSLFFGYPLSVLPRNCWTLNKQNWHNASDTCHGVEFGFVAYLCLSWDNLNFLSLSWSNNSVYLIGLF